MRAWLRALLGALLVAAPLAAAEVEIGDLDLDALLDQPITGASRREEKSSQAAAAVFVLTAEDIRRQGFRTLTEALASVPGLFVTEGSFYSFVGVRGLSLLDDYDVRVLVLLDGHPMSSSSAWSSQISGELPVSLQALERIEVIKGPVGGVYGPTAFFAVINLVTRELRGGAVSVSSDADGAKVQGGAVTVTAVEQLGEVSLLLHAGILRSTGHDYLIPELLADPSRQVPAGGAVPGTDYLRSQNAYLRGRWRSFELTAGWSQRLKGDPWAAYTALVGDGHNNDYNRMGWAQLTWEAQVASGLQLTARASLDDFRTEDYAAYAPPPDGSGDFRDIAAERVYSGELRARITPAAGTLITVGAMAGWHDAFLHSFYVRLPSAVDDPVNGFGKGVIPVSFGTVDTYLDLAQQIGNLSLQGSLSFNHQLLGQALAPKLAAVFQASPQDTLKLIYAHGFRPPTAVEAWYDDGYSYLANPAVRAERADSLEAIWERRISAGATFTASAFANRYSDMIDYVSVPAPGLGRAPDPTNPQDYRLIAQNGSQPATLLGVEAIVKFKLAGLAQGWAGVSVQRLADDGDGNARVNFAPVTSSFALSSHALWEPLTLGLDGHLVGRREKVASLLRPGEATSVDAYLQLGASARLDLQVLRGASLQLTVTDLLGQGHQDPLPTDFAPLSTIRSPGRSARLSAEVRF